MLFDSGSVETVQEPFPGLAIDAFAIITEFGDPLFFIVFPDLVEGRLLDERVLTRVVEHAHRVGAESASASANVVTATSESRTNSATATMTATPPTRPRRRAVSVTLRLPVRLK